MGSLGEEAGAAQCQGQQTLVNSPWGPQPHWWQLRESVFKKHKTPERRREPTGETAEGTPKSEKEEQPCGKADFPHGGKV